MKAINSIRPEGHGITIIKPTIETYLLHYSNASHDWAVYNRNDVFDVVNTV